ncbi:MAG: DUF1778 domain-containing protein [Bifidobacteriaceae bacterium]|nr:DUF1778 domain-containing protein [Bifidobacteriaceae bacterium]
MSTAALKDERLAVRLTKRQKQLIERAAQTGDQTLTEFSVSALVDRAEQVLADRQRIVLSPDEWAAFNEAIDHPARVLPGLREFMEQPSVS